MCEEKQNAVIRANALSLLNTKSIEVKVLISIYLPNLPIHTHTQTHMHKRMPQSYSRTAIQIAEIVYRVPSHKSNLNCQSKRF